MIPTPEVEEAGAELEYVPTAGDIKRLPPYYRRRPDGSVEAITRAEYKKGMLDEFTVKHPRIPACDHTLDVWHGSEPRHRNCESCWFAFFQIHGEMTQYVESAHAEDPRIVVAARGSKFLRNFRKFMSTVATMKAQLETQQTNA